ncbi:MAG: hypothetical protein K0M48_00560 [Thiobacillus sp.]|nr:hypothetical protein [Thiobacillus sp.]
MRQTIFMAVRVSAAAGFWVTGACEPACGHRNVEAGQRVWKAQYPQNHDLQCVMASGLPESGVLNMVVKPLIQRPFWIDSLCAP